MQVGMLGVKEYFGGPTCIVWNIKAGQYIEICLI